MRKSMMLVPSLAGGLDSYLRAINHVPILTSAEERELAVLWQRDQDLMAAQKLVLSHLRFVVHIARGYSGYGLPQADLVQEGNIGLMKAVKRFDPNMNVRLVSFAVHWIRAEMHEYILRNWRIVKVATTKAQRKLFFNLRGAKKRLGWMNKAEVDAIAADLGVPPETVMEMESRLSGHDTAFDAHADVDDDNASMAPAAYLQDLRHDPATQLEKSQWEDHSTERLRQALVTLDERSRDILQHRWLADKKLTLQDLADKYQVSAERIRQLENNAIKKLKATLAA